MNEQIKTFSLVVITICVFIMTVIDILNMVETKKHRVTSQPQVTTITPPELATRPLARAAYQKLPREIITQP